MTPLNERILLVRRFLPLERNVLHLPILSGLFWAVDESYLTKGKCALDNCSHT
jgi:hypothetical protein